MSEELFQNQEEERAISKSNKCLKFKENLVEQQRDKESKLKYKREIIEDQGEREMEYNNLEEETKSEDDMEFKDQVKEMNKQSENQLEIKNSDYKEESVNIEFVETSKKNDSKLKAQEQKVEIKKSQVRMENTMLDNLQCLAEKENIEADLFMDSNFNTSEDKKGFFAKFRGLKRLYRSKVQK